MPPVRVRDWITTVLAAPSRFRSAHAVLSFWVRKEWGNGLAQIALVRGLGERPVKTVLWMRSLPTIRQLRLRVPSRSRGRERQSCAHAVQSRKSSLGPD